jgi:adenylate kinase
MLLLAPPGAGKGTQGVRLAEHFGVTHIAAGDLLREEINGQSERGRRARAYVDRGELVPDQVVIDLVTPAAVAAAAAGGFVLDGFYLDVPEDELTARLLRRATKQGRTDDTPEVIRHRLHVFAKETQPLTEYYRSREFCFPSTATNRSKR